MLDIEWMEPSTSSAVWVLRGLMYGPVLISQFIARSSWRPVIYVHDLRSTSLDMIAPESCSLFVVCVSGTQRRALDGLQVSRRNLLSLRADRVINISLQH